MTDYKLKYTGQEIDGLLDKINGVGKTLVLTAVDETSVNYTANMTLTEAIEVIGRNELVSVILVVPVEAYEGHIMCVPADMWGDLSDVAGFDAVLVTNAILNKEIIWTANGISTNAPF